MTWSEQQNIEFHAPEYLRNVIRIIRLLIRNGGRPESLN